MVVYVFLYDLYMYTLYMTLLVLAHSACGFRSLKHTVYIASEVIQITYQATELYNITL